jgi:uncharacterized membrane protein
MNSWFRPVPRLLVLLSSLLLLGPSVRAKDKDDDESGKSTAHVQFSDPGKPGTLKLTLPWAEARITAVDGKEVTVTSTLDQKGRKEVDSEGFRRIDEDVTFELVEKDNLATITIAGDNQWAAQGAEFDIKVPRNTNLILRTEAGGDIEVNGVEGDLDISSMNGDVTLRDIGSSAVVNTMNGEISATFKHAPVKPVSLSSMNGEIDLRLPTDTKANLRMRTHNGSIRTNFAEGVLQAKSEKTTHVSADARPQARGEGLSQDEREVLREIARQADRADREQAKVARDVAKAVAQANQIAANVSAALDHDGVIPPIPPVAPALQFNFGGKSIVGTLNGGGVDIKLTSMNGTITLRETK